MENKRSKGVTFFGWCFILTNILQVIISIFKGLATADNQNLVISDYVFAIFNFLLIIGYVICGIYILQLKELARKIVIILILISCSYLTYGVLDLYSIHLLNLQKDELNLFQNHKT